MKLARGTQPIEIGSFVGNYEVCDVIGRGGMGVVFDAERAGQHVALKVLLPQLAADDYARRRFCDEAVAGSIVDHPNVATTLEHGYTDDDRPYLVMERVCGQTLGTRIACEGVPSLRTAVAMVQQILAGLGALHEAGIVHGDLKSDNVLVERLDDGRDRLRLIDFGLAHPQFGCGEMMRHPCADDQLVSGTPEYMAPEVARGEGSSMASDLYAVGIILYELIVGATPFVGGTANEVIRRHLEDEVVPPSLRCNQPVPPGLERILARVLAKNPAERYATARELSRALTVIEPLLDHSCGTRLTQPLSRNAPTLEWHADQRRRVARGTPPCRARK